MKTFKNAIATFAREEDGAQVVEYALIIAVVSLTLILALGALAGPGNPFATFITKVGTCLTTGTC